MTTATGTPEKPTPSATERLREQAHVVGEDLKTLGHVAKEVAGEKLGEARQSARSVYDGGRHRAESELDRLASRIRDNPLQSIAIAAGIGALIGLLMRRRD